MLAQAIVDGAEEAGPEPGVVFGGEIGGVVWEFLGGGGCKEDFWGVLAEDGEELRACVGREGDVWD